MSLAHEDKDFSCQWRERVEEWLQEEGWVIGHRTAPGTRWLLTVRDNQGRPLAVGHLTEGKDRLVIQMGLALESELEHRIAALSAQARRDLIFALHEAFILTGIQYAEVREPLSRFILESVCYFDGLSKNELFSRIRRVRDAGMLAMDKISRALDQAPPLPPTSSSRPIGFDLQS